MMNPFKYWLTYPDSLTERLRERAGEATLQVLAEGFGELSPWDMQMLNLSKGRVWRRDIMMSAKGEPCWYACSIVHETTFLANLDFFDKLKTHYLGQLIYNSSIVHRVSLVHGCIDRFDRAYQWLPDNDKATASDQRGLRLSTFMLYEQWPFYLVEFFLPGLERYCD